MAKTIPWFQIGRPYGAGYHAPSTAQFITDKAMIHLGEGEGVRLKPSGEAPTFMEIVVNIVPLPNISEPTITCEELSRPLFDEELKNYQYKGIQLIATDMARLRGEFVCLDDYPQFEFPPGRVVCELPYDPLIQDVTLSTEEVGPVWALGGLYQGRCDLNEFQQSFVSFYVQEGRIQHRLTHLEDWWKMGMRPPFDIAQLERSIGNVMAQEPYVTMLDALREGNAQFSMLMGVDDAGKQVRVSYHSIDGIRHGDQQAIVTFRRK